MAASSETWSRCAPLSLRSPTVTIALDSLEKLASCHPAKPVRPMPCARRPESLNRIQTIRTGTFSAIFSSFGKICPARRVWAACVFSHSLLIFLSSTVWAREMHAIHRAAEDEAAPKPSTLIRTAISIRTKPRSRWKRLQIGRSSTVTSTTGCPSKNSGPGDGVRFNAPARVSAIRSHIQAAT